MKFLVNKLLINGSVDFPNKEAAQDSPFALELFKFNFVNGVFFCKQFCYHYQNRRCGMGRYRSLIERLRKRCCRI
ncbi:NifU N-terminal domain-containing protein [Sphingobacterium sp. E70]|nr:NifU N-terminal domain-containing protein [Sphingobacterium sp. E70]